MLPIADSTIESPWDTFEQAKSSFDQIIPFQTTKDDLTRLSITPLETPNVRILSYLDIISKFMPNASITKQDIDDGLLNCIKSKHSCQAYEVTAQEIVSKRYGNVVLDVFRFNRKTHKTGWNFKNLSYVNHTVLS